MSRCGRCDEPIQDGEEYTAYNNPGASFGGSTVYRHVKPCTRVQTQTAPATRHQPSRQYR